MHNFFYSDIYSPRREIFWVWFEEKSPHSSVKIITYKTNTTYSSRQCELTGQSPVTASCSARTDCLLDATYWRNYNTASHTQYCSKVVHKDFIMTEQRFTQIWKLVNEFGLLLFCDGSKLDNKCLNVQIHLHCLAFPHGVDLLWGDKKCQSHSRHDQLCLLFTVDRGTSGGHEDTDTAKTLRVPCWRYNWHFQWSQSGDSVDGR